MWNVFPFKDAQAQKLGESVQLKLFRVWLHPQHLKSSSRCSLSPKYNHVHLLLLKRECVLQLRRDVFHVKLIKGEKRMCGAEKRRGYSKIHNKNIWNLQSLGQTKAWAAWSLTLSSTHARPRAQRSLENPAFNTALRSPDVPSKKLAIVPWFCDRRILGEPMIDLKCEWWVFMPR